MAKKSRRKNGENVSLEMTPMIDVVFQLLIFFIVTLKQDDILGNLDALRPAPDPQASKVENTEPIKILVGREGFFFQGNVVTESVLKRNLEKISKFNKDSMILIQCEGHSPHGFLIKALDICNSVGLYKLSVFSL